MLEKLVSTEILTGDGGGDFKLTNHFKNHMKEYANIPLVNSQKEVLQRFEQHTNKQVKETQLSNVPIEALVQYIAIAEFSDVFSHRERLTVLILLNQLRGNSPPQEGCPNAFLPVHADRIELLLSICPKSIVYIWRDDCPPCQYTRNSLEQLFDDPRPKIGLFSIYGPDWRELLLKEFDVHGGPTVLFVDQTRIESRLYRGRSPEVIENEFNKLMSD